ncbi:hypothetical protein MTO96_050621 [Rhipicephalus appendiculatus]
MKSRQLSLKWVLEGLLRNTVITEIALDDFIVDADSSDIMTEVLARNHTLRILDFSVLTYDAWMSRVGGSTVSCQTDFSAWLTALARNQTLEAVTLPLKVWEPEEWEYLFGILSERAKPFKLTIKGHCSERYLWEKLCGALRRTGMEEQVSFDTTLYILDKHEMIECKAFSKFHSFPYQDDRGEVSRIFRRLPSFTHVTSAHLEIWIPDVDEALSSDIADYIANNFCAEGAAPDDMAASAVSRRSEDWLGGHLGIATPEHERERSACSDEVHERTANTALGRDTEFLPEHTPGPRESRESRNSCGVCSTSARWDRRATTTYST